jgi:hypothetical protein
MTEPLSTEEVAHAISHKHAPHEPHDPDEPGRWREELIEILEGVLLAIVAVSTAWSGYQTARWDGKEAHAYQASSTKQSFATQASTRAGQVELYDSTTFSFWLQAHADGDAKTQLTFARRFRPAFQPAFQAWLKTDPFHNPKAPAGPLEMPQYHNALATRADALNHEALVDFEEGTRARHDAEEYLRNTVLLAMVLFLIAVAQRLSVMAVRRSMLVLAGILLVVALYFVFTFPTT